MFVQLRREPMTSGQFAQAVRQETLTLPKEIREAIIETYKKLGKTQHYDVKGAVLRPKFYRVN